MVIASGLWLWHALKNKTKWQSGYLGIIGLYAAVGVFSIALGIFLLQTIPFEVLHIGKSALHYFRYLEYFSLFFIAFSGIRTKKQATKAVFVLAATTFLIIIYGIGQKYLHFPLYSTMNREYSKGQAFYLEEGGKISATFGGHYDLAAYLVIILPLLFSFSLQYLKKSKGKLVLFVWLQTIHLGGAWLLLETASKAALIAYIFALAIVIALYLKMIANKRLRTLLSSAALLTSAAIFFAFLSLFGSQTKIRFSNLYTALVSDQQNQDPNDLVGNGYEWKTYTQTSPDGEVVTTRKLEKSTWSPNALRYGISMGIRLDTLWPQALKGLSNNPLFGSGYGTLSKLENTQFVEADSTDNNYLRTLGETGLLGFITFYGFVLLAMRLVWNQLERHKGITQALSIGYLGASLGLLVNALYIDVFAASKVAFVFWGITGFVLRLVAKEQGSDALKAILMHLGKHKTLYAAVLLAFFLLQQNPLANHSNLLAFHTSTPAFENFVAARCFRQSYSFALCRNSGLITGEHFSFYSMLLLPFLWLSKNPAVFYYLNLSLVLTTLLLMYKKLGIKSLLSLLLLVVLAYEYNFTGQPLEDSQLLRLMILAPAAILLLQKFILAGKHARVAKVVLYGALMLSPVLSANSGQRFLESFRNSVQVVKRDAVLQANSRLTADDFLITVLSPYYIDLFSDKPYQVLPLSPAQTYMDTPERVWGAYDFSNMYTLYERLLAQGKQLFLSDYGLNTNKAFFEDYAALRQNFDVRYANLDCYDQCALLRVNKLTEKISPLPSSITTKKLEPSLLSSEYSFAVISNRYDKTNTQTEVEYLGKLANQNDESFAFMILTGDIVNSKDSSAIQTVNTLFANQASFPVLYSPGNYDLLPSKPYNIASERFYSDRDYFILLDIGRDSVATKQQQLFVYNALLELEQLPNIQNLFIISHDLNWQDRDNPNNFIFDLEEKLAAFPELKSYILTADHAQADTKESRSKFNGNSKYYANTQSVIRVTKNGEILF